VTFFLSPKAPGSVNIEQILAGSCNAGRREKGR